MDSVTRKSSCSVWSNCPTSIERPKCTWFQDAPLWQAYLSYEVGWQANPPAKRWLGTSFSHSLIERLGSYNRIKLRIQARIAPLFVNLAASSKHLKNPYTSAFLIRLEILSGNGIFASLFCPTLIPVRELFNEVAHDISAPFIRTVSLKASAERKTSRC